MDELVIRFGKKWRHLYLWIAICRLSRQVIAYFLGNRSFHSLQELCGTRP
jgi:IS1 family transposase